MFPDMLTEIIAEIFSEWLFFRKETNIALFLIKTILRALLALGLGFLSFLLIKYSLEGDSMLGVLFGGLALASIVMAFVYFTVRSAQAFLEHEDEM